MRCLGCGYELWNMQPGCCPECGRRWSYGDFAFRPGRVQFLCPHCEHAYAGLGPDGRPWPESFDCRACGQHVTLDLMRALPAPGMDVNQVIANLHPWEERARTGRWRAFWRTAIASMLRPAELGRSQPPAPNLKGAIAFASAASLVSFALPTACLLGWWLPSAIAAPVAAMNSHELQVVAITLACFLFLRPVLAMLQALVAHVVLSVTGPVAMGWRSTAAACLYGLGPAVLDGIPGLSCMAPVGSLWSLVSCIVQVMSVQRVSGIRASVAVLLLPALILAAMVGILVWSA
jgi:hypothetical protein